MIGPAGCINGRVLGPKWPPRGIEIADLGLLPLALESAKSSVLKQSLPDVGLFSWSAPVSISTAWYKVLRAIWSWRAISIFSILYRGGMPDPPIGDIFYYAIRPQNGCGLGPLGYDASGVARIGRTCP